MIDLLELISGDNLFKYSFTFGVILYAFSIIYPMQKKHELEIENVKYYEELALLKYDVERLKNQIKISTKNFEEIRKSIDESKKEGVADTIIKKRWQHTSRKYDSLQVLTHEIRIRNIKVDALGSKTVTLKRQIDEFDATARFMKWIGILLGAFGFIFWTRVTFKNDS